MYNPNGKKKNLIIALVGAAVVIVVAYVSYRLGWLGKVKQKLLGSKPVAAAAVTKPAESGVASGEATIQVA